MKRKKLTIDQLKLWLMVTGGLAVALIVSPAIEAALVNQGLLSLVATASVLAVIVVSAWFVLRTPAGGYSGWLAAAAAAAGISAAAAEHCPGSGVAVGALMLLTVVGLYRIVLR